MFEFLTNTILKVIFNPLFSVFFDPFFIPVFTVFFILLQLSHSVSNLIKTLVLVEVILLSLSLGFVLISLKFSYIAGQVFALFILALAACESALSLSLLIMFFRNRGISTTFEDVSSLKG